ncbi:MAG: phosphoribosylformylglycinamidine synthase subunit PurL [Deltaproteobacteria bacterium]|nr:phosphoribosylformylglycinamidine synthase subunit PurL [Deltaproteobacteria bacterium]
MKSPEWLRTATLEDALSSGLKENEFSSILEVLGRDVNLVELGIFSALYSEHCSYKSTKVHLKTLPTTGERVIHGPGENAGVVDIGDGQAVAFKVESHNHPTFIEPYQGAATGVGGILRDVFTMGARPLALMNGLRFGEAKNERTSYLLSNAVAGIGDYGNCMGIPTVAGELFFHKSYNGNCLVNAFALGLVDTDKIFLGEASGVGNPILYVGSKTGRDGIHGATMASEEFDDSSDEKRPTVQVGDPFQEKLLLEACLEIMQGDAVVGIQDMGAAGLTSSAYEMASRAGTGIKMELDKVPQREEGMNPYELMLSESQERMLLIAHAGREHEVVEVFQRWGLDAVQIGTVIEGGSVELYWHGDLISSMPVDVLVNNAPQYRWPEAEPADFESRFQFSVDDIEEPENLNQVWLEMIGHINLCSRQQVYDQYDSSVRTNTVLHPGSDSGLIRVKRENGPEKGVAMTLDCNSRYCGIDPHQGAAQTVAESYRNISATGALPIGVSDCLNFGSPEKPEGMWQIAEAVRGMGEACRAFEVPIVSGNASLYNETKGTAILPTPTIAMVGLINDASKAVSSHFKSDGDAVLVFGETFEELGGSEYLGSHFGIERGKLPVLDYDLEVATANFIRSLIEDGLLKSAHDISSGGLAAALTECCFSRYGKIGATLKVEQFAKSRETQHETERRDTLLFSETGARYVVSCDSTKLDQVRKRAEQADVVIGLSGKVGGKSIKIDEVAELDLDQAYAAWRDGLTSLI